MSCQQNILTTINPREAHVSEQLTHSYLPVCSPSRWMPFHFSYLWTYKSSWDCRYCAAVAITPPSTCWTWPITQTPKIVYWKYFRGTGQKSKRNAAFHVVSSSHPNTRGAWQWEQNLGSCRFPKTLNSLIFSWLENKCPPDFAFRSPVREQQCPAPLQKSSWRSHTWQGQRAHRFLRCFCIRCHHEHSA